MCKGKQGEENTFYKIHSAFCFGGESNQNCFLQQLSISAVELGVNQFSRHHGIVPYIYDIYVHVKKYMQTSEVFFCRMLVEVTKTACFNNKLKYSSV